MMVLGLGFLAGCDRDVRLAGRKLRDVQVRTVSYYGMTLDPPASPVKVAYVLLRAIRDDFLAADDSEREAALDIQFDVCAADAIQARNDIGLSRAEALYNVVYRWTPTVSHYANDFQTEWEEAQARLVQMGPRPAAAGAAQECQVVLELTDPDGDPNAGALLYVWLIKDSDYWRVLRMGFFAKQRSLTARQSTATELPEPKPSSDSR